MGREQKANLGNDMIHAAIPCQERSARADCASFRLVVIVSSGRTFLGRRVRAQALSQVLFEESISIFEDVAS